MNVNGYHDSTKQCAQNKLKIVYKYDSRNTQVSKFFLNKIKFLGFHGVVLVKTFPLMYQLLM